MRRSSQASPTLLTFELATSKTRAPSALPHPPSHVTTAELAAFLIWADAQTLTRPSGFILKLNPNQDIVLQDPILNPGYLCDLFKLLLIITIIYFEHFETENRSYAYHAICNITTSVSTHDCGLHNHLQTWP